MTDSMKELEQMRREWVEVTRRNGFREGITDLLAHQYSKKTHFIFELLQNAEDAGASVVEFRVESERVIFSHNGKRLFTYENVESITSIGRSTKQTDYTQIGKHGIGFKAVFAYTHAPRIHSGDKHFVIEDVVVPRLLSGDEIPNDIKPGETRTILPFDSNEISEDRRFRELVPAESALVDISDALMQLSSRTLLFLRHIEELRWTLPDGKNGAYLRETTPSLDRPALRHVELTDGNRSETWAVFQRVTEVNEDGKNRQCAVEVAFLLQDGHVIPAQNTELVVYFPTEKKTELGFLIQGPFKTTKARDNIAQDSTANQQLIETAAKLAADSLEDLRSMGLLQVESYKALPLQSAIFQDDGTRFFMPVYQAIREALKSKPLLPRCGGDFVVSNEARLARGAQLADVFSPEQLGALFGVEQLYWLDTTITADRMPELRDYLAGRRKQWPRNEWEQDPLVEGIEVEAKDLASRLTASFFQAQDESWLVGFYEYMDKNFEPYRNTPFIRLENGQHVSSDKAFLPPRDSSGIDQADFPLVKKSLAENTTTLEFLRNKAKLREPDAVDVVIRCLLPKYSDGKLPFDQDRYSHDLNEIALAYQEAKPVDADRLVRRLKETLFVACIPAGAQQAGVFWKLTGDPKLYRRSTELEHWFSGNCTDEAWFPHPVADKYLIGDLASKLGYASGSLIKQTPPNSYPYRRPDGKFDSGADIYGLNWVTDHPSREAILCLWNLLLENVALVKGKELRSTNKQFPANSTTEFNGYSKLGKICTESDWLPKENFQVFHRPADIFLSDLPCDFEKTSPRAEDLARAFGMKQPIELESLAQACGMTQEQIEQRCELTDEEVEEVLKRRSEDHDFPDKKSPSPDRRREKVREKAYEAPRKTSSQRERSVQDGYSEDKTSAKQYLSGEYTTADGSLFCQLDHKPMPFKLLDSEEWHFEAVECVPDTQCRYPENHLALSPHYAALFKFANHDRDRMRDLIRNAELREIKVRLANETYTLRFTSQHLDDLKNVLDVDAEKSKGEGEQ